MCGIVAAFGTIYKKHEDAFKLMLMFDTIRGPHSTGVGSVLKSDLSDVTYLKSTGTPWNLFSDKQFNDLMNRFHVMLLGHNRFATKGAITSDNAHPFIHGPYMGVHNGTIWNQKDLDDHKKFSVDSENIYYHMSRNGVEETIKAINGAFALVWYNKDTKSINAIRNDQRPLHYTITEDGQTIFFASEPWMLHVALTKAEIKFTEIKSLVSGELYSVVYPEKHGDKLELTNKKLNLYSCAKPHYRYDAGLFTKNGNSNSATSKSGNIVNINDKKYKKYVGESVYFSVCGLRKEGNAKFVLAELDSDPQVYIKFFDNGDDKFLRKLLDSNCLFKGVVKSLSSYGDKYYLTIRRNSVEEVSKEEFDKLEEQNNTSVYKGFGDRDLNLKEWEFAVAQGCHCCGKTPSTIHADFLTWLGPRSFLCPECDEEFFKNELTV